MKKSVLSSLDIGDWAQHYAKDRGTFGHYKDEVYPMYGQLLAGLPEGSTVLDVGAGPGNLAVEYFKVHPARDLAWILVDASANLLDIAQKRLEGRSIETVQQSFNHEDWASGLPPVAAIASNNALFHVAPENLARFYATCFSLLRAGGFMINQQAFAYSNGQSPYGGGFPGDLAKPLQEIMPQKPALTESEERQRKEEKDAAKKQHQAAIEESKAQGVEIGDGYPPYRFVTVEKHLEAMRSAGFDCGCIWRKLEFAIVCGVKMETVAAGGR